jgi:hypothetical protein
LKRSAGKVHLSVSRIDLFADVQGWKIESSDRSRFVCRANDCRIFESGRSFRGFQFGLRTSKTLTARIYDKTADIEDHGGDWWHGIWSDRFQPGSPVIRVEFEFARQALAQFCVDTPAEVLAVRDQLWAYATDEWLSFRDPTSDHSRSRWPVAPEWTALQAVRTSTDRTEPLERITAGRASGSLRKLFPALTGYLASFAAVVGTEEIGETLGVLDYHLRADEQHRRIRFRERVARRRAELTTK